MSTTTPGTAVLPNPPSPKVIGLSVVMLLVQGASAALLYLNSEEGAQLYATLPVILVVVVRSLLAGLSALVVGLRTWDPQRVLDLAISPKVLAGVGIGILAQVVVDLAAFFLGDGQGLYSNWPPVLVVALSSVIPALAAFAAGYATKDPARLTPQNQAPQPIEPVSLEQARASVSRQAVTGQHFEGQSSLDEDPGGRPFGGHDTGEGFDGTRQSPGSL